MDCGHIQIHEVKRTGGFVGAFAILFSSHSAESDLLRLSEVMGTFMFVVAGSETQRLIRSAKKILHEMWNRTEESTAAQERIMVNNASSNLQVSLQFFHSPCKGD